MRQVLGFFAAFLLLLSLGSQQAAAACRAIDRPTSDYLVGTVGTEKCSLGQPGTNTTTCKDSDGNVEAKFSNTLSVRGPVPSGWRTWSSPPESESATPIVGFNMTSTLTVTLADGYQASTAGMEIEPNVFQVFPITVVFRDLAGSTLLSRTINVNGGAGARLFAATCDEELINSMVITIPPTAQGFAIAQVRSDSFVILRDDTAGAAPANLPEVPEWVTSNTEYQQ